MAGDAEPFVFVPGVGVAPQVSAAFRLAGDGLKGALGEFTDDGRLLVHGVGDELPSRPLWCHACRTSYALEAEALRGAMAKARDGWPARLTLGTV